MRAPLTQTSSPETHRKMCATYRSASCSIVSLHIYLNTISRVYPTTVYVQCTWCSSYIAAFNVASTVVPQFDHQMKLFRHQSRALLRSINFAFKMAFKFLFFRFCRKAPRMHPGGSLCIPCPSEILFYLQYLHAFFVRPVQCTIQQRGALVML